MRSTLKLLWARFFTLAGWQWKLSHHPGFDFEVSFVCDSKDCPSKHTLLVRICDKPAEALQRKHERFSTPWVEPAPALFGDGPLNTCWQMVHGSGGGLFDAAMIVGEQKADALWKQARNG